jgi:hypothetical protein
MNLDTQSSKDLRLLAVADLEAGVVGQHREIEPGQARAAQVGLCQLRALPVDAVEIAADQRGGGEIGIDERRLRELAGPELAVLQEQARQVGEADVAALERGLGQGRALALENVDCRNCTPRKLESTALRL